MNQATPRSPGRSMGFLLASIPLILVAALPAGAGDPEGGLPAIEKGPFLPQWESLESQYHAPDWFRDGKLGIWTVWGPQSVPEQGDWYARNMYRYGSAQYQYHLEHYGHPSATGFIDILPKWTGEKFDPEALTALFRKAGAKYIATMVNHHENFDYWNSKYHPWNSVAIGPKKDIVGLWEKAARRAGLRFGVTVHTARTWQWWEVAQGSDPEGPKKGIPYDGKLTKADGKGKWWDGMDPQELYAQNHPIGTKASKEYCELFFRRVKQLVDDYRPDLLYFDDSVMPLKAQADTEVYGLALAAHFYNSSIKWHSRNEGVLNIKGLDEQQRKAMVWDIERGKTRTIAPEAWQNDTCIGDWHYKRSLYENHSYKTVTQVVTMFVDVVSKNGNLLLNIPLRGDGSLDPDEVAFLEGLGNWMAVNGEAIYGSRPWKVCGEWSQPQEEKSRTRSGSVSDVTRTPYTAADIRFTTKGDTLYAILLAWPQDGVAMIKSLAEGQDPRRVTAVHLLGHEGTLPFVQDAQGLKVTLPSSRPCDHAYTLKIE